MIVVPSPRDNGSQAASWGLRMRMRRVDGKPDTGEDRRPADAGRQVNGGDARSDERGSHPIADER
jgi:hypothetical protein